MEKAEQDQDEELTPDAKGYTGSTYTKQRNASYQCVVCKQLFRRITHTHVQKHGMTLVQYRHLTGTNDAVSSSTIAYKADSQPILPAGVVNKPTSSHMRVMRDSRGREMPAPDPLKIAAEIFQDKFVIRDLAAEVSGALMSGPQRQQVAIAVTALIQKRLLMHGAAAAFMEQVRTELAQPWRTEQGGKNGGPTKTEDLVSMGHLALAEIKHGEDLLIKAARLALEEQRVNPMAAYSGQGQTFSGTATTALEIPDGMSPGERETVRLLHRTIVEHARKLHNIVDVPESETIDVEQPQAESRPAKLAQSTNEDYRDKVLYDF